MVLEFLAVPGQGSQFPGMGRRLASRFPVAAATLDEVANALGLDMRALMWDSSPAELTRTEIAQPAIVTLAIAAYRSWQDSQSSPSIAWVTGHSIGALGAAAISGALSVPDAVRLARKRGEIMSQAPGEGSMLAVAITSHESRRAAESLAAEMGLDVACVNGYRQVVLSGAASAVNQARRTLGARSQVLEVSHGFHSRLMDPVLPKWAEQLEVTRFEKPAVPYLSSTTGQFLTSATEVQTDLLVGVRQTVRWDLVTEVASSESVAPVILGNGRSLMRMWRGTPLANLSLIVDDDFVWGVSHA